MVRFLGAALTEGRVEHLIEGVPVMIYSPANTVADCFKFRNKIGLNVALEALRECVRQRKATMAEIRHFAEICRVARVVRYRVCRMAWQPPIRIERVYSRFTEGFDVHDLKAVAQTIRAL